MARKVFIAVLGTGFYNECCYYSGTFVSRKTRFVQEATLALYGAKDWPPESKAYILLTPKAREENWLLNDDKRINPRTKKEENYTCLRHVLEQMQLSFEPEGVSIPDGKNEAEMWEIFQTAFELLNEGDELYLDLTHGFRYLPMLMLVLGNYAKFLKDVKVCGISYGNFEVPTPNKPIVDLTPLSSLQDWTFAIADYLENGYSDRLTKLSMDNISPLLRNPETRNEETKLLRDFVKDLNVMSEEMLTCRGKEVISGNTVRRLREHLSQLDNVIITQLEPVLEKVAESIKPFSTLPDNIENTFKATGWCLKNQLYQQAITFLEEGVISYFCHRHGIILDDSKKRGLVTSAFKIKQMNLPEEKWDVNEENKDLLRQITNDEKMSDESLIKTFNALVDLRNNYNHCGMNDKKKRASDIKKQAKEYALRISDSMFGKSEKKVSRLFINLSNHPSSSWSDEQKTAAMAYGEIIDLPFPTVTPEADEAGITTLTEQYISQIEEFSNSHDICIHIMGEMTFTYRLVSLLKEKGITCLASTTERIVSEHDGVKTSTFKFVRFREY